MRGRGQVAIAAIGLVIFCGRLGAQGIDLASEPKGTLDAGVWSTGIVAQHDSVAAFNTYAWMGGASFGRVMTPPVGIGWLRGSIQWDFGLGPVAVFSPQQNAYGAALYPIIGRWNFVHRGRVAPYFEMAAGMVFTNANVPPGDTSSINVNARLGFGWQIFTRPQRSVDLGLYAWHLSNAWTGRSNPSANGIGVVMGYHWWFPRTDEPSGGAAPVAAGASAAQPDTRPAAKSDPPLGDPAPAITGTPGMFTVETAEVLRKGEIIGSAYANQFARAPGSVSILENGLTLSAGITNRITAVAQFDPYIRADVGAPAQLSLNPSPGCMNDVFKAPAYCVAPVGDPSGSHAPLALQGSWQGPAAAYVPGYPFLARSSSDYGPVALGVKVNFWSETRNDPLSVSLRTDFYLPTESAVTELTKHGLQTGALNYSFSLALSKTLRPGIVLASNVTYMVNGNPMANGAPLLTPGDEVIFGQGFIIPIWRGLQFLSEYNGYFFQEGHAFGLMGIDTQNTVLGPSVPVDGLWGVRWNLRNGTALDLGYRYMLNLHQVNNRSGFVVQISNVFHRSTSE